MEKVPNLVLRAIREQERHQSRDEFARDVTRKGEQLGEHVACDGRLVGRWEDGDVRNPRPVYRRILAALTCRPFDELGFAPTSHGRLPENLAVSALGDRADTDPVTGMCATAAHYRSAYHSVPASRLLPAAIAHLNVVTSLQSTLQPPHRRAQVLTAIAEMATLAGVLLELDASRHRQALSYFDLAWSAARSADDIELQTVILGCRSFALGYGGGDYLLALECADLARTLGEIGACAETRGWVAAVASEHCASIGDLAGCRQRLEESWTALTTPDSSGVVWRGIGGFTLDKLRAYEGGDMCRLGRYRDAEAILDQALDGLDDTMPRHRATALIDRAEARLGAGDIDAACTDTSQALRLVVHVQHTGNLKRISAVAARAAATGASAARALHRDVQLARADCGLLVGGSRTR